MSLIKYKDIEDLTGNHKYIEATIVKDPLTIVKLAKEIGNIIINDKYYKYEFAEFLPSTNEGTYDLVVIYVSLE